MSSAFWIECPLRLNNEHDNRGRLCNEKYGYTGAEKKNKKRAQDETRVHAYSPSRFRECRSSAASEGNLV